MVVGSIMRACRERAGLTQEDMGEEMQMDQATISRIENGRQTPDVSTFKEWVDKTQSQEVMVAYFYGIEGIKIIQHIMNQSQEVRA
ncbi:helix-turn-helix transcriptional regulator [Paenibacillus sp. FSL M7-0896]|uniref:helix-turn-helix domain-containing protein n=1 Tax=Paenibacillus sp. FSL M7-0896 TaxID=2921610 RepID=UPI0030DC14C3